MQTSVAPSALRLERAPHDLLDGRGSSPPRCAAVREKAQKRHALTHTLVKLMLRLTT